MIHIDTTDIDIDIPQGQGITILGIVIGVSLATATTYLLLNRVFYPTIYLRMVRPGHGKPLQYINYTVVGDLPLAYTIFPHLVWIRPIKVKFIFIDTTPHIQFIQDVDRMLPDPDHALNADNEFWENADRELEEFVLPRDLPKLKNCISKNNTLLKEEEWECGKGLILLLNKAESSLSHTTSVLEVTEVPQQWELHLHEHAIERVNYFKFQIYLHSIYRERTLAYLRKLEAIYMKYDKTYRPKPGPYWEWQWQPQQPE